MENMFQEMRRIEIMRILIINPNSSGKITERIRNEAERVVGRSAHRLEIDAITSVEGPSVIENSYDELVAAFHVVNELKRREKNYDAAVIACAADPGLPAAKEILDIPVTGIFEAAVHVSNIVGKTFSVIGSCGYEDIAAFKDTVSRYGYETRAVSFKYLDRGVDGINEQCKAYLKEKISEAKYKDGADAIILGCAAFAGMCRKLSEECGVYVTDGIAEAIWLVQMMSGLSAVRL